MIAELVQERCGCDAINMELHPVTAVVSEAAMVV